MSSHRRPGTGGLLAIEKELQEEKTSTLSRMVERLEALLVELRELDARVREVAGAERLRVVARHDEIWVQAERQRWYVLVQREAMGMRNPAIVYEMYPLPRRYVAELRAADHQ